MSWRVFGGVYQRALIRLETMPRPTSAAAVSALAALIDQATAAVDPDERSALWLAVGMFIERGRAEEVRKRQAGAVDPALLAALAGLLLGGAVVGVLALLVLGVRRRLLERKYRRGYREAAYQSPAQEAAGRRAAQLVDERGRWYWAKALAAHARTQRTFAKLVKRAQREAKRRAGGRS